MKKLSDILGLPLISTMDGKNMGRVKEILLKLSKGSVAGFVLDKGSLLRETKIVDITQIKTIGDDAIILPTEDIKYTKDYDEKLWQYKDLISKPVYTHSGKSLGVIEDIFINITNGHIIGFEVSEGIIYDILEGRGIIPLPRSTIYGKDTVVVPNYVMDFFEKNKGKKQLILERLECLESVWQKAEEGADYWSNVEKY